MSLESQGPVKSVSVLASEVGRKRELVATRFLAAIHGKSHHRPADSPPPPSRTHSHIFHHARPSAQVPEVVHDEQSESPDQLPATFGHIDAVVGILSHSLENRFRPLQRQCRAIQAGLHVEVQDGWQIALFGGTDGGRRRRACFRTPIRSRYLVARPHSPATVIRSSSREPQRIPPRASTSLPTATISLNIRSRLPAMVISWTGY